jgi:hypothetical protein
MVKRKTSIVPFLIIGVSIGLIYLLSQTNTIFEAVREDSSDTLEVPAIETQSLFKTDQIDIKSYYLLSTEPFTQNEDPDSLILRAGVENPFSEASRLNLITVSKNDAIQYQLDPKLPLFQPNQKYIYSSEPINMVGKDAQINTVSIEFKFTTLGGQDKTQKFQYAYYSLTECFNDNDCGTDANVCDIDNVARFSKTGKTYCVKTCVSNAFCYEGQVCINGRCGY